MAKKKTWDKATIDAAVKAVLVDKERTGEVGERYGVPPSTLGKWLTDARNKQKEFMDYAEKVEKEIEIKKQQQDIDKMRYDDPERVAAQIELDKKCEELRTDTGAQEKPVIDENYIKAAAYDVITIQMALHPGSSTDEMMCFIQGVQALAQLLCSEVE